VILQSFDFDHNVIKQSFDLYLNHYIVIMESFDLDLKYNILQEEILENII